MTQATASQALQELAEKTNKRSKMGRLRELLPDIEAAQLAGVSNEQIVETLNKQGLDITPKAFSVMLTRARKQVKEKGLVVTPASAKPALPAGDKGSDMKEPEQPAKPETTFVTKTDDGGKGPPTQQQLKDHSRSSFDMSQFEDDEDSK